MQTKYDFISFVEVEKKPKTSVWSCISNNGGYELGRVKWYGPWRQYSFFPVAGTVFNSGCLYDVVDFLRQLKENRG
jgi:hypothetical protein